MRYNNRFFKTKEEAVAFQKQHGGAIYSNAPRSRSKTDYHVETMVAWDARHEVIDPNLMPWCVAWNESEDA